MDEARGDERVPWVSTAEMQLRRDDPVSYPPDLMPAQLFDSILPFVATTQLGPKNAKWDISGLYIPSRQASDKVMLCAHGHGSGCTALAWVNFFDLLVNAGFNIIAFDAPCFGRSSGNQTGQANLWRSNDYMLILRLLDCFCVNDCCTYAMAQCMGAAMLLRAISERPSLFAHRFVVHNATIGSWPKHMDSILKLKGGVILGWHELDNDHMREAVCYKNLKRISHQGLSIFIDSANERLYGTANNALERRTVYAPHLSRCKNILIFDPSVDITERVVRFFLSKQHSPEVGMSSWSPPAETAVAKGCNSAAAKIDVCIRLRPFLPHERRPMTPTYEIDGTPMGQSISCIRQQQAQSYVFKNIFTPQNSLEEVCSPVFSLVEKLRRGETHVTVIAYGQTASGKTHTIEQLLRAVTNNLILERNEKVTVKFSQIYKDRTFDLLSQGVTSVDKSCERIAHDTKGILSCFSEGSRARAVASTAMNVSSSRSHALFCITLSNGRKFSLVDLAGSERIKKSLSSGSTLKEAADINTSLLVLSRVLRSKINPNCSHIPYRDSALTQALEDTFESPNHKAVLFACISPCEESVHESDQTLRFASNSTYVKEKSKLINKNDILPDVHETEVSRLKRAALTTEGCFGKFGECRIPSTEQIPSLHCFGRDGIEQFNNDEGLEAKTIILLHYYGGSCFESGGAMWNEKITKFAPHFRVIALSFSGHGLSEGRPPRSSPEEERFLEPGGAVAQVLRAMEYFGVYKAHVVGYDYGGGVAMQLAISFPNRLLSAIVWNPSYRISSRQEKKPPKWFPVTSLIVSPSVWMPVKKTNILQAFMKTKPVKCNSERDVWRRRERIEE